MRLISMVLTQENIELTSCLGVLPSQQGLRLYCALPGVYTAFMWWPVQSSDGQLLKSLK